MPRASSAAIWSCAATCSSPSCAQFWSARCCAAKVRAEVDGIPTWATPAPTSNPAMTWSKRRSALGRWRCRDRWPTSRDDADTHARSCQAASGCAGDAGSGAGEAESAGGGGVAFDNVFTFGPEPRQPRSATPPLGAATAVAGARGARPATPWRRVRSTCLPCATPLRRRLRRACHATATARWPAPLALSAPSGKA